MNPHADDVTRIADAIEQRMGTDRRYAARLLGELARRYLANQESFQMDRLIEEAVPKQQEGIVI